MPQVEILMQQIKVFSTYFEKHDADMELGNLDKISYAHNFRASVTLKHLSTLPDKVPAYELQPAVIFPSIIT
jgi:hypothetical protein